MPASITRALAILFVACWCAAITDDAQAQFFPGQTSPQYQQPPPRAKPKPRVRRPSTSRPRETRERTQPATPPDKRDSIVAMPGGPYNGRAYWLALAQCGGIYFKLNTMYTDAAVRARVIKPDPKANAQFTKDLNDAIKTASAYFAGAERFLTTDRGLERPDSVLTYDGRSREAGDRVKTIEAALAAAKTCYPLYQTCHEAFPKACSEASLPIQ